jgi:hypothetical protein
MVLRKTYYVLDATLGDPSPENVIKNAQYVYRTRRNNYITIQRALLAAMEPELQRMLKSGVHLK